MTMINSIKALARQLATRPKLLFLTDAAGSLLTAFLLGVVLVKCEDHFGVPEHVLFLLAAIACTYTVYSFCCAMLVTGNFRPWLRVIAIANILYACLTVVLLIDYSGSLMPLGWLYFLLELTVIGILVAVEWQILRAPRTGSP